jgi:hypothetical protein
LHKENAMVTPYLSRTSLLTLAGLGLLFLPFAPGFAQQRAPGGPGQAEQADQQKLDALRAHLEAQLRQLQEAIQNVDAKRRELKMNPMAGGGPGMSGMPGMPGMPGMAPGGRMGGPGGMPGGDNRMQRIEQKLDMLIWEITAMRRDMANSRPAAVPVGELYVYPPTTTRATKVAPSSASPAAVETRVPAPSTAPVDPAASQKPPAPKAGSTPF